MPITAYNPNYLTPMMTMIPMEEYTSIEEGIAHYEDLGYEITDRQENYVEMSLFDRDDLWDPEVPESIIVLIKEN